jgi:hypothetical protein
MKIPAAGFRPRSFPRPAIGLIAALLLMACAPSAPPGKSPAVVMRNGAGRDWTVTVEVARTVIEQAQGLMFRWSLAPNHGMIFIYRDADVRRFWMKNTRIPLDMIFIAPDRRIAGIVARAEPYTETIRSVPAPAQWVLEVAGGEAEKHGLKSGDRVFFFGIEEK